MDDLVLQYFGQLLTWSIQNFAAGTARLEQIFPRILHVEDIVQYIVSLNTIIVKLYYRL